jgi:hypothetical protein
MQTRNRNSTLRECNEGHQYYKSSECPVCSICEKQKSTEGFLSNLAAPARRALQNAGITTLEKLSAVTENEYCCCMESEKLRFLS